MSSEELCRILKYDREKLPEFLKNNCNYDYLKNLLMNLELQDNNISDLFLGKKGYESNKQQAIYELPTEELLIILKCICDCLNIKTIEEMGAGQGLLSNMLRHHLDNSYNVVATDGAKWIETSNTKKYYNITSKLFLEYCLDNVNYNEKLLIVSWIAKEDILDFLKLLEIKKPMNVVIIGCPFYKYNTEQLGYTVTGIPVKQLCFNDYYKDNKYFPTDSCRSSILLLTRNTQDIINNVLLNIKLKHDQCLCKKMKLIPDKVIIQDIIKNCMKKENKYLIDYLDNADKFKKISRYLVKIMRDEINDPIYLKKYREFIFWIRKTIEFKYPKNITTREKFKEYLKLLKILGEENGLNKLKEIGIIPGWVNDTTTAEKFIWLDYSYDLKAWKKSEGSFNASFNQVYSLHSHQNSFVNFVSFSNASI